MRFQESELENLQLALRYAALGWPCFPVWGIKDGKCLCAGKVENCKPGKHPYGRAVPRGHHDGSTDAELVKQWFRTPHVNVGVDVGRCQALVLDPDAKHGGLETLARLVADLGPLPEGPLAESGGGGRHIWLARCPEITKNFKLPGGIDVLVSGAVIMPPSLHQSGRWYHWLRPPELLLPLLPPAWLEYILSEMGTKKGAALDSLKDEWPSALQRSHCRPAAGLDVDLLGRVWQAVASESEDDPTLMSHLADRARHDAHRPEWERLQGVVKAARAARYGPITGDLVESLRGHFQRAVASNPSSPVARLDLAESSVALGQDAEAVEQCRRALELLARNGLGSDVRSGPRFPPVLDLFAAEWQRAGWENAGDPGERLARERLLRWRLHALLADLTGELIHYHESALARPDLPAARAALGCALARGGRLLEALPHLRWASACQPFDEAAARALHFALEDLGDRDEAREQARRRRILADIAPGSVPREPWFAEAHTEESAPRQEGAAASVSLCLIVRNEEYNLGDCLDSARGLFAEVIVVDTGSTDRTIQIAREHGAKVYEFPWIDSFAAARNECLRHASGAWIFWLDADDRLDEANRERLRSLLAALPEGNVAFSMKCRCLPEPGQDADTVVDHVRLFRNDPRLRWRYRVHEQILPAVRETGGEVRFADVTITHTGYSDPALRRKKLRRDLRLLEMEYSEQPHDPFTLFNLGSARLEQGRYEIAGDLFAESLARSDPRDSIVRKLYALLSDCRLHQGRPEEALRVCLEGQRICPDDAELLLLESSLRSALGDLQGARAALIRLRDGRPSDHFASVVGGLRGHRGLHELAVVTAQLGDLAEAERLWREALTEVPSFVPALAGLAELLLALGRAIEAGELLARLEALPPDGPALAARLKGGAQ